MLIFGHVGLTTAAAQAVRPGEDLRAPALMSLLPDLIDKPVRVLWPALVNDSTRGFAHSLAGAAVVLIALVAARGRRPRTALLWACYAGHLVLDRMWLAQDRIVLLWPLLGPFPRPGPGSVLLAHLNYYDVGGEFVGLLLLLELARRHRLFERARLLAFCRTGELRPA